MIYNLRPMSFDDIGFNITVERALDKLRNSNNIRCNFKTSGDEYMVDSLVSLTLLRVIQEACSNSIKHGHAKEINVSLKYEPKSLTLTIRMMEMVLIHLLFLSLPEMIIQALDYL